MSAKHCSQTLWRTLLIYFVKHYLSLILKIRKPKHRKYKCHIAHQCHSLPLESGLQHKHSLLMYTLKHCCIHFTEHILLTYTLKHVASFYWTVSGMGSLGHWEKLRVLFASLWALFCFLFEFWEIIR